MITKASSSPVLLKYLKAYDKNPKSRVFAPLAEAYRKLGMAQEALEVLKEGLACHPDYVMGRLTRAQCYFDEGFIEKSYKEIKPYIADNPENLKLLSLFARSCYQLGLHEEAQITYENLIFIDPKNREFKERLIEIGQFEEQCIDILDQQSISSIPYVDNGDQWTTVDITTSVEDFTQDKSESEWKVASMIGSENITQESTYEEEKIESNRENFELPIMTLTLVDLYCDQGLYEKATEVLNGILSVNRNDEKTLKKLEEVKILSRNPGTTFFENENVQYAKKNDLDGSEELMRIFDNRFAAERKSVVNRLQDFLHGIKQKAVNRNATLTS